MQGEETIEGAVHITVGRGGELLTAAATIDQRIEIVRGKGAPRLRRLCQLLDNIFGFENDYQDSANEESDEEEDDLNTRTGYDALADEQEAEVLEPEEEDEEVLAEEEDEECFMCGRLNCDCESDDVQLESDGSAPEEFQTTTTPSATEDLPRLILFCLFKKEASEVARKLVDKGYKAVALQGNMGQRARDAALASFRTGENQILVATDVAARGLDVGGVTHVINYSVGMSIEYYVHRIGRCGRAGRAGVAHTFVVDGDEKLVQPLCELLTRHRQVVPRELLALSQTLKEEQANNVTKDFTSKKQAKQAGNAKGKSR